MHWAGWCASLPALPMGNAITSPFGPHAAAGELVARGAIDAEMAAAIIAEAATRAGLTYVEALRTAQSGVRTGAGHA
jgi:hypothetical protein